MRRKSGTLLPIEEAILAAAVAARSRGEAEFHGFGIAHEIQARDEARRLTAHGTLYRALTRMDQAGLLDSRWEDPAIAIEEGRPRRRLYAVTPVGVAALSHAEVVRHSTAWRPGPALS